MSRNGKNPRLYLATEKEITLYHITTNDARKCHETMKQRRNKFISCNKKKNTVISHSI